MKRIIILVLIGTINAAIFAQFTSVTPKVGMTFSNMNDYFEKYKIGYLVGASTEYRFTSKFALKPELLLEQKGGRDEVILTDENGWAVGISEYYLYSNYLSLPIQLKYSPFNGNKIFFLAGGYAGYLLWANNCVIGADGKYHSVKADKAYLNLWDVGLSIGSGLDIPLSEKSGIQVDFKYEYALLNSAFFSTANTFSLSLGYMLNLGK